MLSFQSVKVEIVILILLGLVLLFVNPIIGLVVIVAGLLLRNSNKSRKALETLATRDVEDNKTEPSEAARVQPTPQKSAANFSLMLTSAMLCAGVLIMFGTFILLETGNDPVTSTPSKNESTSIIEALEVAESPLKLPETPPANKGIDVNTATTAEQIELLGSCKRWIVRYAGKQFVGGAQIVGADWEGSIGATASILGRRYLTPDSERVGRSLLNTGYVAFGLRDGFSGLQQSFMLGKCEFTSNRSAKVSLFHMRPGASLGEANLKYVGSENFSN